MNPEFLKELIVSMTKRYMTHSSIVILYQENALVNLKRDIERETVKASDSTSSIRWGG